TDGAVHATDATNAARTMLLDIHTGQWDPALLDLFRIPAAVLPAVRDSTGPFGDTAHFGGTLPIRAMVGDQQGALIGQGCTAPGMVKSTYGTGCFALLHTGDRPVPSAHRLLTTIALQRGGRRTYALEGSIFVAGAAVQWLRDGLGLIAHAAETGMLAATADPAQDVYLVPAFVGLGAPHWDPDARGILTGITRSTGRAELARAALECVAYQTQDLMEAMRSDLQDAGLDLGEGVLRVDGGMSASDWAMQFLADTLDLPVDRPRGLETTALGAAYLAGLDAGLYPEPDEFARTWRAERRFMPQADPSARDRRRAGWQDAVRRSRGH
ncbi:MAG: glycerol kinase, partial [Gemmatimonadaceae bacterium]|nr:glycerol kinase [Acetobacteraceae bacterium]